MSSAGVIERQNERAVSAQCTSTHADWSARVNVWAYCVSRNAAACARVRIREAR
jgi:hypothetical protein